MVGGREGREIDEVCHILQLNLYNNYLIFTFMISINPLSKLFR